jgi:hypothetical protein
VYCSLFHQYSTYPATYAALPHLVQIAETGTLGQRVAILCLAGELKVYGHADEPIPNELLSDFELAMLSTTKSSLKTLQEARAEFDAQVIWSLGDLLLAFGGLRYPKSGFVVQLNYLAREGWNVEANCPSCDNGVLAEIRARGITTLRMNARGHTDPESAQTALVDRSNYATFIAKGHAVLDQGNIKWPLDDTPFVLAALADQFRDRLLADRILDLATVVACPYCRQRFELSSSLEAL